MHSPDLPLEGDPRILNRGPTAVKDDVRRFAR
jgi:hypothetical protein